MTCTVCTGWAGHTRCAHGRGRRWEGGGIEVLSHCSKSTSTFLTEMAQIRFVRNKVDEKEVRGPKEIRLNMLYGKRSLSNGDPTQDKEI